LSISRAPEGILHTPQGTVMCIRASLSRPPCSDASCGASPRNVCVLAHVSTAWFDPGLNCPCTGSFSRGPDAQTPCARGFGVPSTRACYSSPIFGAAPDLCVRVDAFPLYLDPLVFQMLAHSCLDFKGEGGQLPGFPGALSGLPWELRACACGQACCPPPLVVGMGPLMCACRAQQERNGSPLLSWYCLQAHSHPVTPHRPSHDRGVRPGPCEVLTPLPFCAF
jgi:hypothetical protein